MWTIPRFKITDMAKVLVLIPEGFEEIETVTPIDLMRRAGIEVTTAALDEKTNIVGRSLITIQTDTTLSLLLEQNTHPDHDLLMLPGGPGVKHLRGDLRVHPLVKTFSRENRWIAAICAAPIVLHDAGLLVGKRYTAHNSASFELKAILSDERVVVDGRIITSRGAGTSIDFGLAIITALISAEKAREIAAAIHY
jgi:4-methyl-5(b-hydroxyethyl)-thiazole monophosphate biosynthesis